MSADKYPSKFSRQMEAIVFSLLLPVSILGIHRDLVLGKNGEFLENSSHCLS